MPLPTTHEERLARARVSLDGLSVGDAFGERFFSRRAAERIQQRQPPEGPWWWTDDTNMALSIMEVLDQLRRIDQDALADSIAEHYEPSRGYGAGAHRLLQRIQQGANWRKLAPAMFGGEGSFGNGAAMRIAPLGAYFADDLELAVQNASLAAQVTHQHPEGIAGAMAVAAAAGLAARYHGSPPPTRAEFIDGVLAYIPAETEVKRGCVRARDLDADSVRQAVEALGNGSRISAMDTVPYVLWCAGEYLDSYEEALWQTVSGGGDRDTTCAIVGGIVVLYTGADSIPDAWLERREDLPRWPFVGLK